jgi:hypothetical protein
MARTCHVCTHPDVEEINKALIEGRVSYLKLEETYGISHFALARHKRNHLEPVIQEIKDNAKETAQKDYIEGKEAANMILKHLPQVLAENKPSLKELIEVIKIVSGLDNRSGGAGRDIIITWGIGAGDKGKIQISDNIEEPEGITDDDVSEIETETEKRKSAKNTVNEDASGQGKEEGPPS